MAYLPYLTGGQKPFPTGVLTKLPYLWVSASLVDAPENETLYAYAKTHATSFRTFHTSLIAATADKKPCLIAGLEISKIADYNPVLQADGYIADKALYNISRKPDLDRLQEGQLPDTGSRVLETREKTISSEKEALCLAAISTSLEYLQDKVDGLAPPLERYVYWMRHHTSPQRNPPGPVNWIKNISDLYERVENYDIEGKLLVRVAQALPRILSGEVDPLSLLFSDDSLNAYYREADRGASLFTKMGSYVDLLAHKNPSLRILEVGAGTGSATQYMMNVLGTRFKEYVYTDVSKGFFSKAQERFESPKMTFKILDVSKDPLKQNFEPEEFDLIIAANVSKLF